MDTPLLPVGDYIIDIKRCIVKRRIKVAKVKIVLEVEVNPIEALKWLATQTTEDTMLEEKSLLFLYTERKLSWLDDSFDTVSIISMEIL